MVTKRSSVRIIRRAEASGAICGAYLVSKNGLTVCMTPALAAERYALEVVEMRSRSGRRVLCSLAGRLRNSVKRSGSCSSNDSSCHLGWFMVEIGLGLDSNFSVFSVLIALEVESAGLLSCILVAFLEF